MMKSMTAYARGIATSDDYEIRWELKTLNQRYLDISMRLPDALSHLEMAVRELIQQQVGRGKLEATCRYRLLSQQQTGLPLDSDRVAAVIASCNEIEMQMGVGKALSALDVLQFPGVIAEKTAELQNNNELVLKALTDCLSDLQKSREAEGLRLQKLILERADKIALIVAEVKRRQPEVLKAVENKLRQRVAALLENINQDRLEQELVFIAQKLDVDEELDRLDSHLLELKHIFKRDEPVGRRLDFLMQEFNREANTLGAKSADVETTQAAIDLKVLIEQMREQVQNIE